MNWKLKNNLFFILQNIPFGMEIYYVLQKYVTKSVWVSDNQFPNYYKEKVANHLKFIKEYGKCPIDKATIFEFGAGWDMLAPIGFALNGAKKYIAVDINRYAHPELVKNTIELYKRNFKNDNETESNVKLERCLEGFVNSTDKVKDLLREEFSIEYFAPMDAGNTNFESGSFDYVISNVSLEHIPYDDIERIFGECNRILKADGLISATVDYSDHFAHSDPNISVFNYMQYSDSAWEKYNSYIHFQNRLRRSDYIELLTKSGFEIVTLSSVVSDGNELKHIKLDQRFAKYPLEELLITHDHFLARKKV
ncbi:class I SAM-dependent methyltransferase [Anaerovibrio lipolyticus]|uniref:class I SAM-dependent methyltransferase n=1 Tax=Anaerovibrio lipolyticus TaxID=82374 RepID=UPI00048499BE|nr:class I SAM-dependent methyltransferase [Anaerovibrio lipolyticus]